MRLARIGGPGKQVPGETDRRLVATADSNEAGKTGESA